MTWLIIWASISGYFAIAGAVGSFVPPAFDGDIVPILSAMFWPLALPLLIGVVSARKVKSRLESRRDQHNLPKATVHKTPTCR